MKKRFRFLRFFCVLLLITLMTSLTNYKKYTESVTCFSPIQDDVVIMAEFGLVKNSDNEEGGIGVVSFKVGNELYAIGHEILAEDISNLSVYKVLPTFEPSIKNQIGSVFKNGSMEELLGKIIKNSNDGVIISVKEMDVKKYPRVAIAENIFSSNAELLMRDETGRLQNYSISVEIVEDNKENQLEINITDDRLLSKTGGIVRGMSGSPIIQNHKLIGVVTHVYLDKPWQGKGKIIWSIDCIKKHAKKQ